MQQRFSFLAQQFRRFRQPVIILDLEATGGNLFRDRITEIAYLRFDGEKVQAVQHLVNPQTPISDFIANLTGISNDMVAHAPIFADLLPEILADLRGGILVAHNSHFDYTLLVNECRRAGVDFAAGALCTVKLSKKLYPDEYKHSLDAICERFALQADGGRHRAMTDVLLLADFLQLALREHGQWLPVAQNLLFPPALPQGLSDAILADLACVGDGYGVAIWRNALGDTVAARIYERGFANAVADVAHFVAQGAKSVHWQPALGFLDALCFCQQNGHRLDTPSSHKRYTVAFVRKNGCLKAEMVRLKNGILNAPPHGIFMHIKAAEKALLAWAKSEKLCLTMLGVNPHKLPENAPCPAFQAGLCNKACENGDVDAHNAAVLAALARFPFGDWHWFSPIAITETDLLTQQSREFVCERGALRLSDGRWYCGGDLLDEIKRKAKQQRDCIRILD